MLDPYLILANAQRFRELLQTCTDEGQRRTIEALLEAETEKLGRIALNARNTRGADAAPKSSPGHFADTSETNSNPRQSPHIKKRRPCER